MKMTDEEFDRLYDRAIERMRRDQEKKKMLLKIDSAIRELAAYDLASSKKAGAGRVKTKP